MEMERPRVTQSQFHGILGRMPIDVHAHYVPLRILETLERRAADFGVDLLEDAPGCQKCLQFQYGARIRPFFPRLLEVPERRIEAMRAQGIDRQILSLWADIFGHGLPLEQGLKWHQLMNESLAELCEAHPRAFSWLASGPLPHAGFAARELERAVKQRGAAGGVVAANIEGVNLGEFNLDEYWAAAVELGVPVFIHPAQPNPTARTKLYALNQIAQYTFDTSLCVGSLIGSGVLDRFPKLELILSHGGGAFPYLVGRFDCMHGRMDRAGQKNVAAHAPSAYLGRFSYDSILHDPSALVYLARRVGIGRIVLGSDDPFPPMDRTPLATLQAAEFSAVEIERITDANPRRLFRLPA